jgi:long-chain acyl-CoA synthetase
VELKRGSSLLPISAALFYAMTEASAVTDLDPGSSLRTRSAGRVCAGVEVRIVDDKRQDVAPGETGEIAVRCGGPGYISCGYSIRRQHESIVDGWVFTGDMAISTPTAFYLVDRKKDMIVSGRFNIFAE